ncbi:MAG: hypothetical protein ACOYMN_10605, partial [Roseimicrobium sp.]
MNNQAKPNCTASHPAAFSKIIQAKDSSVGMYLAPLPTHCPPGLPHGGSKDYKKEHKRKRINKRRPKTE